LRYHPDADILVVELGGSSTMNEERLNNNVVIGYSEDGRVVRVVRRGL